MLGIKVKDRFLDIKPDQSIEMERKSPFFAIEEAFGEATPTPISFFYTENNCIALDWVYQFHSRKQKQKIEVEVYDDSGFFCLATLIISTGKMNVNRVEDSEVTGHLLFGASHFLQLTNGKLLSDLKLGGIRTFNFTTNNPTDGSNGYWQHFHQSWTDSTIPYVFQPTRNAEYFGEAGDVEWMNELGNDAKLKWDFYTPIVPFIRLKYLLQCIFNEFRFTVDFSGLNDAQWERMIMPSLKAIDWVTTEPDPVTNDITDKPKPVIQIDLSKHVPPKKTITDFIIQLFNRYGWAPVFDLSRKRCTIVAGKELGKRARKDWTIYAEPSISNDFGEDERVFSFITEIDPNDKFPVPGDFANAKFAEPVVYKHYLPAPTSALEGRITFVYYENRYYQVALNETSNEYEWQVFSDNIFDDEKEKATDTITTTISTMPCYLSLYRTVGGVNYYGVFPVMQQEFNSDIGYRLLTYQGLVQETKEDGIVTGPLFYPQATSSRNDSGGPLISWSNTYHQVEPTSGEDFGLIPYWWKWFLWLLQSSEENEVKLNLPRHELVNLKWDDEILISNVSYLVKSLVKPLPYEGFIIAKMKRFVKKIPVEVVGVGAGGGSTTVVVYARLTVYNIRNYPTTSFPAPQVCDVKINLYSDAAGNLPYKPLAPIYALVQTAKKFSQSSTDLFNITTDHYAVNNAEEVIMKNVWFRETFMVTTYYDYKLLRNAPNGYEPL